MNIYDCYKVTTTDCKSCGASFPTVVPELIVQYSTQSWATPNNDWSSLFVFKDLVDAQKFVERVRQTQRDRYNREVNLIIWKARAINMKRKVRIVKTTKRFSFWRVQEFWQNTKLSGYLKWVRNVKTLNYYIADAVKLTEIVIDNNVNKS